MSTVQWVPVAPAPNAEWLRQFTGHLRVLRPGLPIFSARQLALQAFDAMHLLTPVEASELWDQRMLVSHPGWRRLADGGG